MVEKFWRAISLAYRLSVGGFAIGITSGVYIFEIYSKNPSKNEIIDRILLRRLINLKLGGFISGTLLTGILMNFSGRKCLHNSLLILCMLAWFLILLTKNHIARIIGQFLVGFSHGGLAAIIPIYASEMVPVKFRGSQILTFRLTRATGFFIGIILIAYKSVNETRIPCINAAIVSTVALLPSFFLPESPFVLMLQGKTNEAAKVLNTLYEPGATIQTELDDIKAQINGLEFRKIYFIPPLKRRGAIYAFLIIFYLSFIQLATKLPFAFFWSSVPAESLTVPEIRYIKTVQIMFYMAQIFGTASCDFVIDVVGRRPLLIVSTFLTQISIFGLVLRLQFYKSEFLANHSIVDMIFVLVLTSSHAIGLNGIPWLYTIEFYPAEIKWFGATMISLFTWIRHLMFQEVFTYVAKQRILTVYILYATVLVIFGVYVLVRYIPETSNRKLHEIHEILNNGPIDRG